MGFVRSLLALPILLVSTSCPASYIIRIDAAPNKSHYAAGEQAVITGKVRFLDATTGNAVASPLKPGERLPITFYFPKKNSASKRAVTLAGDLSFTYTTPALVNTGEQTFFVDVDSWRGIIGTSAELDMPLLIDGVAQARAFRAYEDANTVKVTTQSEPSQNLFAGDKATLLLDIQNRGLAGIVSGEIYFNGAKIGSVSD